MQTIFNAKIVTPDSQFSWMQFNENGIITDIGTGIPPESERQIDAKGQLILPGLHDAHIHLYWLGRALSQLDLRNLTSISMLEKSLTSFATKKATESNEKWLVGFGWSDEKLREKRLPNRHDLDRVVSDKPVALIRTCYHMAVVNSMALQVLGIDKDSKNPVGGMIDKLNGEPTGILREKSFVKIFSYIEDPENLEEKKLMIVSAINYCKQFGIVSVQSNDPYAWKAYTELEVEGKLDIHVHFTLPFNEMNKRESPRAQAKVGMLRTDRVKIFTDGALGISTAALREPYSDGTGKGADQMGLLRYQDFELIKMLREAKANNWRVEIHAIGDKAAEQVISCLEKVQHRKPVITHLQVLTPDLITRLKKLEGIANVQPIIVPNEREFAERRLGPTRIKWSYCWKSLVDVGVCVSGGSDAPVDPPVSFKAMYATMFRKHSPSDKSWMQEQNLSFAETLRIYTENPAYASDTEKIQGKLEKGYYADFVIVDTDFTENFDLLLEAKVSKVYVKGKQLT